MSELNNRFQILIIDSNFVHFQSLREYNQIDNDPQMAQFTMKILR